MLYWLTGTAHSAGRLYYEVGHGGAAAPDAACRGADRGRGVSRRGAALPALLGRASIQPRALDRHAARWPLRRARAAGTARRRRAQLLPDGSLNALRGPSSLRRRVLGRPIGARSRLAPGASSTCASRRPWWRSWPRRSRSIPFKATRDLVLRRARLLRVRRRVPHAAARRVRARTRGFSRRGAVLRSWVRPAPPSALQLVVGIVLVVVIAVPLATRFVRGLVRDGRGALVVTGASHTSPRSGRWSRPRSGRAGPWRSSGRGLLRLRRSDRRDPLRRPAAMGAAGGDGDLPPRPRRIGVFPGQLTGRNTVVERLTAQGERPGFR